MSQANTYTPSHDRIVLGVVLMVAFCVTAPVLDMFSKLSADTIPVGQITTARFIVQAIIMLPVVIILRDQLWLPRAMFPALIMRALFLIASTYCFVAAIAVMPIADALAIAFVEPFLLLLFGKYVYGETVGPRRLGASVVGFIGVIMVIQPSFAVFGFVALYPLGTAVFFGLYMLATRSISRQLSAIAMQYHTAWIGAVICVPIMIVADGSGIATLDPIMPQGIYWFWLIGVGAAAALSHIFMSYALSFAPSSTLAPLHYLEIVSAVALGYFVFGDLPNRMAVMGMCVIIASGLYVIYREQKIARASQL
jgi:drug/metabolite transporter (DMT)-like permease